ncbi:MAG: MOSC domain-containing protein [Oligoflexia bacterium]|nr:MOSC domain-containing protein [Oligoflexia bacterium]
MALLKNKNMKILSIQVGTPKTITYRDHEITTGIFKSPINTPVKLCRLNLESDGQADLKVHGGVDKALYAYSHDAYGWWEKNRPQDKYEFGAFGENLTIDHLPEDKIYIGDTFEIGKAIVQVSQPRFPCSKLVAKFNDPSILKTFNKSNRPGVYFRVLKEGIIEAGEILTLISQEEILVSIEELFIFGNTKKMDSKRAQELIKIKTLTPNWIKKLSDLIACEE